MMNITKDLAVATALCTALVATATQAAVPNTFSAGQPARAAEVNANFSDLDDRVTTLENSPSTAGINWADYLPAPSLTKKTYSRVRYQTSNSDPNVRVPSVCDRIELDFTDRTDIIFTLSRSDTSAQCYQEHEFANDTGSGFADTGWDEYWDNAGTPYLARTVRFREPLAPYSTLSLGMPVVRTAIADVTRFDTAGTTISQSVETRLVYRVAVGIENVTVGSTTYNDCLKLSSSIDYSLDSSRQQHDWRCPGVGDVKQVRVYADGRSDIRELLTVQ